MLKKVKFFIGLAAFSLIVGFNALHALNGYGVKEGKLHVEILAQDTGGGGTGSGSGSGSGTEESSGCKWKTQEAACKCGWWALCDSDGVGYDCECGDSKWYPN